MQRTSESGVNSASQPVAAGDSNKGVYLDDSQNCRASVAFPSSSVAATDANIGATQQYHEPHSSNTRDKVTPRWSFNKPRGAKTFAPLIDIIALCGSRSAFPTEVSAQNVGQSVTERPDLDNEPCHSRPTQHGETAISSPEPNLNAEGDRRDSVEKRSTELEEVERLQRALCESRSRIVELEDLCKSQSQDQVAARSFSNVADTCSDTDVIHALRRLNAEMQQNAMYMADCLVADFGFKNVAAGVTPEQSFALERVSGDIGSVLANSLASRPREVPFLLQIAFQAYLVAVLGQIASAWASDPEQSSFINGIYQTLRGTEAQATSGRWRSLARLYNPMNEASLVERLVEGLSDILLVAGCTAPRSDVIAKITSHFQGKMALLVDFAMRLNKIFNEVLSSDFEVLLVLPGDKFEGESMEEADRGEGEVHEGSVVLCATHLGLIKRVPVGTLWEKGQKQRMSVLRAMVLLEDEVCGASKAPPVNDNSLTVDEQNDNYQGEEKLPRKKTYPDLNSGLGRDVECDRERLPRKK